MATKKKTKDNAVAIKKSVEKDLKKKIESDPDPVKGMDALDDPFAALGVEEDTTPKPKKGKKVTTPVVNLDMEKECKAYAKAHQQEKDAKADMARIKSKILKKAGPERLALCLAHGEHYKSVKVENLVTAIWKSAFKAIPIQALSRLKDIFGDRASKYFKRKTVVTMKPEVLNDPKLLKELVTAIGIEKFNEFFDRTESLTVTEVFDRDFCTDRAVFKEAEPLVDDETISRHAASLRVG